MSKQNHMDADRGSLAWGLFSAVFLAEAFDNICKLVKARCSTKPPIHDLPKELLVSIFMAVEDQRWVRHTVPCVCKEWNEIYRSKDASPLHETLEVDFYEEVSSAAAAAREKRGRRDSAEGAPRSPVVHAPRVIKWAQRRAGSVRKLRLKGFYYDRLLFYRGALEDFNTVDLGALVAVAGSSLTEISDQYALGELWEKPFWDSLRDHVVPAGRLSSLVVEGNRTIVDESDVKVLRQLAGSLEKLVLKNSSFFGGLPRFPESFFALKKLKRLVLVGHHRITAIPAGISSLKKLEVLGLGCCGLSSLPKELGELSGLTKLDLSSNGSLGSLSQDEAFPLELGKLKSLRHLYLTFCGLRAVPAFVGGLESLEILDLSSNDNLEFHAPLDFLIEGCPRLREVRMRKESNARPWTPESLTLLDAFEARLRAKNPNAKVSYKPE